MIILVTVGAGCSTDGSRSGAVQEEPDPGIGVSDAGAAPDRLGFQIVSPTITVQARSEITYCYYFQTPNVSEVAVKRWASHMTGDGHQMILFLTSANLQSPGTLTTAQCGLSSSGIGPVWTYAADTPDAALQLPASDGRGNAVAQVIKGSQPGFLQMHFVNTASEPIQAHVELLAYAHEDGVAVTAAAPFVTYNTSIELPAATSPSAPTSDTVNGDCGVAPDAKFYFVSTHTHKQGTRAFVKDGAKMVFDSSNWAAPGQTTWDAQPFFSFTTGNLSYQCEYKNPNGYSIQYGDNAATDEMCVAIGYYFPAVDGTGHFCLNSAMVY
jgi:hypothetical protein